MHLCPKDQPREQHTGFAQRQSAMREKAKTIRRKQKKKKKANKELKTSVTAQHRVATYSVNPGHASSMREDQDQDQRVGEADYCKAEANRVLDGDD
jgi:hypothetical protein